MARGDGCSNRIVGESTMPVDERSLDESSVAASESTPTSMSGVSAVNEAVEAPIKSCTMRSTELSTKAWRSASVNPTMESAKVLQPEARITRELALARAS